MNRNKMPKFDFSQIKPLIKYFLATVGGPYILYHSIYKVEPGYQALKFDIFRGILEQKYMEGYHLLIPFIQRPIIYDCRMKNNVYVIGCSSKDLQIIQMKMRLISRPDVNNLAKLYRLLGQNFEERVLYSLVYEICGAVCSQYNAAQLVTQRDVISDMIRKRLQERSREFYFELDDVALIDIVFSREFSDAIEKKQVAQQEAERMKFIVEQALEDKKSTIIKAMGEAESVKKFGVANKLDSAFLELRKIETARYISNVLKDSQNRVILDTSSLYMNLPTSDKKLGSVGNQMNV